MAAQLILNFHGVGAPHAGVDDGERPYWVSEEHFRDIVLLAEQKSRAPLLFTFDDGNASDLAHAAPFLAERGHHAIFFLLAGRFDQPHYLTRADAAALIALGHEVGLHGRHHRAWPSLDDTALADETIAARAELAAASGRPVRHVGIPFGAYDRRVMRHLRRQDFATIQTSDGGLADDGALIRNRTSIRDDMPLDTIARLARGEEPLRPRLRRAASTFVRRHLR